MSQDPIIEEIRRIREEYAARFNYDIEAIAADAMRRQGEDGRKVVQLNPVRATVVVGLGSASESAKSPEQVQ